MNYKNNYIMPSCFSFFMAMISSCVFFPGFMSFDSFYQYGQALGLEPLTDVHPPIMSYIWRALCVVTKSPGTLLFFDQIIYWLAILLFACAVSRRSWRRVIMIGCLGFWPPLYITSLHLWADAGMMAFLALTVACLAVQITDERKRWLVMAGVALFVAASLRHNAITGVIPLMCYIAWRFARNFPAPVPACMKILASLFLVLVLGQKALSIGVEHVPQLGTVLVWDLTAISVAENKDVIPDYVPKTPGPDFVGRLRSHWDANTRVPSAAESSPDLTPAEVRQQWTPVQEKRLIKDWLKAIIHDPGAYAAHRMHVAKTLLGLTHEVYLPYFYIGIDTPNAYGIDFKFHKLVYKIMHSVFDKEKKWIIYKVWIYALIELYLLSFYLYRSLVLHKTGYFGALPAITVLSGIMIELPLFILAPAAHFRYSVWLVFSTLLALILTVSERYMRKTSDAA
ncbi:hypothetical protein [Komagataeibacter xylinus]|uniref:Glycosyltransferase RgtA/B/C/D-like domain-containing protein n=1 Tax=Komagataeibacter xylinus TaxID=28448 RepID=A0A857FKI3_KOMXY|nr:hypothetical protein [Komagataeibacter xylinus]QHC34695.1 hypothetical protein FMA36_03485 [Komagataeibacter xylinus]